MTLSRLLASFTGLFLRLVEAGLIFVAFIVLIYILLGADSGSYVISVVSNLTGLIGAIGPQALVGIALVLALVYLVKRRA
jgi:hypothetical protein